MSHSKLSEVFSLFILVCVMLKGSAGQLAFHTDSQTNSFSVKVPGHQQTFTRYFGGQQGGLLQQQTAASQPQPQITAPHNAIQQQAYPTTYSQPQFQPQASPQPQYISAQDYSAFLQHQQQQQVQPLQYNAQPQYEQQPQSNTQSAALSAPAPQPQNSNLLGVAFSPSSQVSHVKFSSGGLSYNF